MRDNTFVLTDPFDQFLHDFGLTPRQYRWIRQYLQESLDLQDEEYGSREERQLIAEELKHGNVTRQINDRMSSNLLPLSKFSWIKNDKRQLIWIEKRTQFGPYPPRSLPQQIDQRDALISLIDYFTSSDKTKWLLQLEKEWNNQQQTDAIFKWFKVDSEKDKCTVAWEWLIKNKPQLTDGQPPFQSHAGLLLFFEDTSTSTDEKKLYVEIIKRRWTQQQRRKDKSEQQQENFVFDKETSKNLILLAKKYKMTKSAIVKSLINIETLKGGYLTSTQEKEKTAI